MLNANADVKSYAKDNGIFLWQIADVLKVADSNFSRKLRKELPDAEKEIVCQIIRDLSGKGEAFNA